MTAASLINCNRFPLDAVVHVPALGIPEAEVKTFWRLGEAALVYGLRRPDGGVVHDVPESALRAGRASHV